MEHAVSDPSTCTPSNCRSLSPFDGTALGSGRLFRLAQSRHLLLVMGGNPLDGPSEKLGDEGDTVKDRKPWTDAVVAGVELGQDAVRVVGQPLETFRNAQVAVLLLEQAKHDLIVKIPVRPSDLVLFRNPSTTAFGYVFKNVQASPHCIGLTQPIDKFLLVHGCCSD